MGAPGKVVSVEEAEEAEQAEEADEVDEVEEAEEGIEAKRAAIMAANKAHLQSLGIPQAKDEVRSALMPRP